MSRGTQCALTSMRQVRYRSWIFSRALEQFDCLKLLPRSRPSPRKEQSYKSFFVKIRPIEFFRECTHSTVHQFCCDPLNAKNCVCCLCLNVFHNIVTQPLLSQSSDISCFHNGFNNFVGGGLNQEVLALLLSCNYYPSITIILQLGQRLQHSCRAHAS